MTQIDITPLKTALSSKAILITEAKERELYRRDLGELPSWFEGALFNIMPDLVVQPAAAEDVAQTVKFASSNGLAVLARGCSSWGFGGSIPVKGGIVIDFSPFSAILGVDKDRRAVRVQAGARWTDIDDHLSAHGLTLKTYSSSKFTTVGGWLATGGIGINSFAFGPVKNHVLEIVVVTGDGQLRRLSPADHDFKYFFETEGQIGLIVEVLLSARERPAGSFPYLFQFESLKSTFDFINKVSNSGAKPTHIGYIDGDYIAQTNRTRGESIVAEKPSVLIHFDLALSEGEKERMLALENDATLTDEFKARYLWHERLFTMMIKRLGPKILAGESYMPVSNSAALVERVKRIGKSFGTRVSFEGHMSGPGEIVLMSFFLSGEKEKLRYLFHMALSGMIGKLGLNMGGRPYGLGIWNSAFAPEKYGEKELKEYLSFKKETDPKSTLNPAKWLDSKKKGLLLSRVLFSRVFFGGGMDLLIAFSPLVGLLAKASKAKRGSGLSEMSGMERAALICSRCGSCVKVCPAYLATRDERVTARSKLELVRRLMAKEKIGQDQAERVFLCMHCKACEKICQNELHLTEVWDELEERLKSIYGWPKEALEEFVASVEASKEYEEILDQPFLRRPS